MLFTTYEFMGFFLILLIIYYSIPSGCQWLLLLIGSYWFYYKADPRYILYLAVITSLTYLGARIIERNQMLQKKYLEKLGAELGNEEKKKYRKKQEQIRRFWFVSFLAATLGILAIAKYTNFLIQNINHVLDFLGRTEQISLIDLLLPLGISFYTFQAVGYLIDVYWENISAEHNFLRYALFVSFFPQLIQGPISRFGDLSQTLGKKHRLHWENIRDGMGRMLWGYFKKMVVADRIAPAVHLMTGNPDLYQGGYILVLMVLYTVELYADFTGGIDITIGIAQTFGIEIKENFRCPYFSTSLREYWRRWHISMCTWFKDYVFYPISASSIMQKLYKKAKKRVGAKAGKRLPIHLSSFVVWLATGIWHGASWNFVVWGLLNWIVLTVSEELEPMYRRFHLCVKFTDKWGYKLFQIVRTFLLICVLNLFDCYEAVATTLRMLGSVIIGGNWNIWNNGGLMELGLGMSDFCVLLIGVLLMIGVSFVQQKGSVREKLAGRSYPVQVAVWFGLFLTVILWGKYGIGYDASQFIYNRF